MKNSKFIIVSICLILAGLIFPMSVSADVTVVSGSFGTIMNQRWIGIHLYGSDGDKIIASWNVQDDNRIDAMLLDENNYTLFNDKQSYQALILFLNTSQGFFKYNIETEGLYFVVFYGNYSGSATIYYQASLFKKEPTCQCNCTCVTPPPNPSPSPATISGITLITLGIIGAISVTLIIWKIKRKIKKLS